MGRTLFANVNVFDGTGSPLVPGEVLVEGNRITAIARGAERLDRTGAAVIDGGGATLLPGLVEPHAHLTFLSAIDHIVTAQRVPPEQHVLFTAHNARVLLESGFTSAYSAGATYPEAEVAVRDAIAAGLIPGPRLRACSFERAISPKGEMEEHGPDSVRRFVHDMADLGVDSVKMLLSGDDIFSPGGSQVVQYSEEEAAAAAAEARARGLWLNCHAQAAEAVKMAVRNGFRAIYHCTYADEEALDLLEAHKAEVFVAPAIGKRYADAYEGEPFGITREVAERMNSYRTIELNAELYPKMRKRGIRVLPGGDYGFAHNPTGNNARDFEWFVKFFGYTPAEVLKAATQYGAEIMDMGHELGLVKEGYLADLILVDGDPLEDITLFQNRSTIRMIMKDGAAYKNTLPTPARELVVA